MDSELLKDGMIKVRVKDPVEFWKEMDLVTVDHDTVTLKDKKEP